MKKPREGHPIQVVARRTGLTADVLRAWERRYEAVVPGRSSGSRRYYTDDDIERLILLRRATLGGRSIGQVASLSNRELQALITGDEKAAHALTRERGAGGDAAGAGRPGSGSDTRRTASGSVQGATAAEHQELCLEAARALDGDRLETALARASLELSPTAVIEQVLAPLLRVIGDRWREGTLRIAHEHLATAVMRTFLGARIVSARPDSDPLIVVATPSGQMHELGALLAAATAASEGWRVAYLGTSLPAEEIAAVAAQRRARAVALSLVHPADDPRLQVELRTLRRHLPPDLPLLVGGAASHAYRDALGGVQATILGDMPALRRALEELRTPPPAA
jgi:MerR family transcriptional regulator, light-induced transcriptional regulator